MKTGEEIYDESMQLFLGTLANAHLPFDKNDMLYVFRIGLMQGMDMSHHVNWEQRTAFINAAKKDLGIL